MDLPSLFGDWWGKARSASGMRPPPLSSRQPGRVRTAYLFPDSQVGWYLAVDTSALTAILLAELDAPAMLNALAAAPRVGLSVSNRTELLLIRQFLSKKLPDCLSFRPPAVLRKGLHSPAMRPFARLAGRRKSCAIW
jgi:hypothetical protein